MTWLARRVEALTGQRVTASHSLHGGDIADVVALDLADGTRLVAKTSRAGGSDTAEVEAFMLRHMQEAVPQCRVPEVIHNEPGLLLMSWLENRGTGVSAGSAQDAARQIAALHSATGDQYGLERDTVIGALPQANTREAGWTTFFGEHRLVNMARQCVVAGRAGPDLVEDMESLASKLPDLIPDTPPASLLHGDLWSGNILDGGDHMAGLVDPAIYHGHHEVDLAMMTLFANPPQRFFDAYGELMPIEPGFIEERRDLYNLWPLLVHVRLFGGSYLQSVKVGLAKFGVQTT